MMKRSGKGYTSYMKLEAELRQKKQETGFIIALFHFKLAFQNELFLWMYRVFFFKWKKLIYASKFKLF